MMNEEAIKDFLSLDDGLKLLKTIDRLNPSDLPVNKLHTIKDVSVAMGLSLRDTWKMINEAEACGLVIFYGGLLSRKKVDLTDIGENFAECATAKDIKEVFDGLD